MPFAAGQFIMSPRSASLTSQFGVRAIAGGGLLLNAFAIAGYALLGASTPIWVLVVLYFIQGAGLGAAVPTVTTAVMEVLPRERAGAGSALTNTARQIAVALGVAVLGSILAEAYRSSLSPALAGLPAAARGAAGQSISATQAVAQHLGPAGRFLIAPASSSFVDAMRVTTITAAVIAILGGVVVARWLPGRTRPNIEAEVAAEVAAAERELALQRVEARQLSER
jgi:MFS family permease